MSNEVTTWNVRDYKSNVELLLQTEGSMLRNAVMTDNYVGDGGRPVNQIGAVVAQKKTARHADTPLIETPHSARWVEPVDYEWADLIDQQDKLRLLADPQGPYAQNGAYAMGRAMDQEILEQALATSKTGAQGGSTEAFDTTNYQIAVGGTGLTVDKLRTAKRMLMAAKVNVMREPLYIAITAQQHADLLNEPEVTSGDYNRTLVLVDGIVQRFMGFNFIHVEDMSSYLLDGSSDQRCVCWAKSGLHLGIWNDITTRITERDDKSYATQVYVKETIGATRTQQGKVIEIICDL